MHNIAFLGDRKSLLLFRPAGVSLFMPTSEEEATRTINRLRDERYAIIFVTEQVYRMAKKAIQALDASFLPAVIILPGHAEVGKEGIRRMNELIENAVGMKL